MSCSSSNSFGLTVKHYLRFSHLHTQKDTTFAITASTKLIIKSNIVTPPFYWKVSQQDNFNKILAFCKVFWYNGCKKLIIISNIGSLWKMLTSTATVLIVQPFANIIANYIRHNSKHDTRQYFKHGLLRKCLFCGSRFYFIDKIPFTGSSE